MAFSFVLPGSLFGEFSLIPLNSPSPCEPADVCLQLLSDASSCLGSQVLLTWAGTYKEREGSGIAIPLRRVTYTERKNHIGGTF